MIVGFCGKPGSGKSYGVVERVIVPALKAGRTVYHNMPLHEDQLIAYCGLAGRLISFDRECSPAELVANAPPGAMIVIDECMRYWPVGIKASNVPPEEREFFTMHRHRVGDDGRASDIVLVAQDFGSQCAAFIRDLIKHTYYFVKLDHVSLTKKYRLEVYDGFIKGDRPPKSKLIRKEIGSYNKEIYAFYQSHTQSEKGIAGEEMTDSSVSVWRSWPVYAAIAGLAIIVPAAVMAASSFFGLADRAQETPSAEDTEAPASPAPVRNPDSKVAARPAPRPESKQWRYAGEIRIGRHRYHIVQSEHGARYVPASACTRDPLGNHTCEVDGELVAEWTGPKPNPVQRALTPMPQEQAQ